MAKVVIFAVLFAIGVITGSATAADEGLFTRCASMDLVIEELDSEDTQRTGLTEKSIENAVESRLRAARLFAPSGKQNRRQYLYIRVNTVGFAFSIEVELARYLDDLGYGFGGSATVWNVISTGMHGGDGQYILGLVAKYLDEFIASYLRVNEEHCSR